MKGYLFVALLLVTSACKLTSRAKQIEPQLKLSASASYQSKNCCGGQALQLSYIGCGGFYLQLGEQGVLIDPYFSNADVLRHPLRPLQTDTVLTDFFFNKALGSATDTAGLVKTILISHAHHDHLSDLPSILRRNLSDQQLQIIGTQGAKQIITAHDLASDRLRYTQPDSVALATKSISSTYKSADQSLKVTAITSEHAPHFLGMKAPCIGGKIKAKTPPKLYFGYKEGVTYNFMIDFLADNGQVRYRIFSSAGAAANAPIGFPDSTLLSEHPVDLLLLCAASYDQVSGYPDEIIRLLRPTHIFLGHWEDFFTPIPQLVLHPKTVPLTNIPALVKHVKQLMKTHQIAGTPILLHPLSTIKIKI